jgi:hypothetical protein
VDRDIQTEIHMTNPIGTWEIIDVDFTIADADTTINHTLQPDDPQQVQYYVIRQTGMGIVYESKLSKTWTSKYVVLRATHIGKYRLLLMLLKTPITFTL